MVYYTVTGKREALLSVKTEPTSRLTVHNNFSLYCSSVEPSMSVRLSAVCRSVSLTLSVRSPRPVRTAFLFIPGFLLPSLSWTLTQPSSLAATSEDPPSPLLINGGGRIQKTKREKKNQWRSQQPASIQPMIQPRPNLQHLTHQPVEPAGLFIAAVFLLFRAGKSYSRRAALMWKVWNAGKWV